MVVGVGGACRGEGTAGSRGRLGREGRLGEKGERQTRERDSLTSNSVTLQVSIMHIKVHAHTHI